MSVISDIIIDHRGIVHVVTITCLGVPLPSVASLCRTSLLLLTAAAMVLLLVCVLVVLMVLVDGVDDALIGRCV